MDEGNRPLFKSANRQNFAREALTLTFLDSFVFVP